MRTQCIRKTPTTLIRNYQLKKQTYSKPNGYVPTATKITYKYDSDEIPYFICASYTTRKATRNVETFLNCSYNAI